MGKISELELVIRDLPALQPLLTMWQTPCQRCSAPHLMKNRMMLPPLLNPS